jgi:hypothetical protein
MVSRTLRSVFPSVRAFRESPPDEGGVANIVLFASDAQVSFHIPEGAAFESEACGDLLRSFQRWRVLEDVPAGPIVTDAWNPLSRPQGPVERAHFRAMRDLLPIEVWLN